MGFFDRIFYELKFYKMKTKRVIRIKFVKGKEIMPCTQNWYKQRKKFEIHVSNTNACFYEFSFKTKVFQSSTKNEKTVSPFI